MGVVLKVIFIVGTLATAIAFYFVLNYKVEAPELDEDGWWGAGDRPKHEDATVKKLPPIHVSDAVLTDLKQRLKNTRYHTDLEDGDFNYGFQATYMKEVVNYWMNRFDWRKQEKELNKFDHYKTTIEGIGVHYIHVKPKSQSKKTIPLLIVHGWPGSVWEFYKLIPLLMADHPDFNFELICPSIPGYGYSDAPQKKGFDQGDTARVFMKLMQRLGFTKYYIQGGDWGSVVTQIMAISYPEKIIGIHSNFFNEPQLPKTMIKLMIGSYLPWLIYNEGEAEMVPPFWENFKTLLMETGYMHIQASKPDTVGMGLTDSPVGLAGYILEKFGTWTNVKYRDLADGGITKKFTMDELLTNIMIYWTNKNIVPSQRYYKEYFLSPQAQTFDQVEVLVPAGLATFSMELVKAPRTLMEDKFKKIVQYSVMPRGGHFAAFEEPELMASDIRMFVSKVENLNK